MLTHIHIYRIINIAIVCLPPCVRRQTDINLNSGLDREVMPGAVKRQHYLLVPVALEALARLKEVFYHSEACVDLAGVREHI